MYLYFEPRGGITDILCNIVRCHNYCKKHNRILLVNGQKSNYTINFSELNDGLTDILSEDDSKIYEDALNIINTELLN